jgi:hypothetical protein
VIEGTGAFNIAHGRWHIEQQHVLMVVPQQSPPSQSHPALLFPSSQMSSPFQSTSTQPDGSEKNIFLLFFVHT